MDELVKQSLTKWPNVPHCYGWLALDARGAFRMRDESAQAAHQPGDIIRHESLLAFIYRNYDCDSRGAWYFQNGPQRVYVELEATPLIWRVEPDASVHDHTGRPARVQRCLLDELGRLYLETDTGFGLVHTMDMGQAADAVEAGLWVPQDVFAPDLPARYGYCTSPNMLQKK
jgi:hypothetical protein